MINIGVSLKRVRLWRGYTLSQVTCITNSMLSQVENGHRNVSLNMLEELCDFYDVPITIVVAMSENIENQKLKETLNKLIGECLND